MAGGPRVVVEVTGDTRGLSRALNQASSSTTRFGHNLARVGKVAAVAMVGLGVGAVVAGKRFVSLASDAEEVRSKFQVVFGKNVPAMTKNLDAFSKATGTSRYELRQQTADMGALLEPLSANKKAAGDLSIEMVKLATDLSSFNNVPTADALVAIRAGLVGEAEPLRRFGVLINAAAVAQEGLRMGLAKTANELTEQNKVQARASLIMQQTTLAQGDAERTSGSLANQTKRLKGQMRDLGTDLGTLLMPAVTRVVSGLTGFIGKFQDAEGSGAKFRVVMDTIKSAAERGWRAFQDAVKAIDWGKTFAAIKREVVALGGKIGGALLKMVQDIDWGAVGREVGRLVVAAFNRAATFIKSVDWGEAGRVVAKKLVDAVVKFVKNFDWVGAAKAWFTLMKAAIIGLASFVAGIGLEIGKAIAQGVVDGASNLGSALYGKLKSQLSSALNKVKGFFGIGSPSRVFAQELGGPMAEGIVMGVNEVLGSGKLKDEMRTRIEEAIDAARQAIESRRGVLASAFDGMADSALSVFDRLSDTIQTKSEKKLSNLESRRAAAGRNRALAGAQAQLAEAQAGGDPEALKAAQQAVNDAVYEIRRAGLERQAAQERAALDNRRELQRRHLEENLQALKTKLDQGVISQQGYHDRIINLFKRFEIPLKDAATKVGGALAEGLSDSMKAVSNAANALARAVEQRLSRIKVVIQAEVHGSGSISGMAEGGPVRVGQAYIVGERGPELFVPGMNGGIVPSSRAGAAGGSPIVVNVHGSVLSEQELGDVVRRVLVQRGRQTGGNLLGGFA